MKIENGTRIENDTYVFYVFNSEEEANSKLHIFTVDHHDSKVIETPNGWCIRYKKYF